MPGGTWLYSVFGILFYERSILSRIRRKSDIRTRFRNVRGSIFGNMSRYCFLSTPCAMRIWNTRCKSFVILGEITCPGYMPTCFHVLQISDKSRSKNRLHQGIASIMIYPLHVRISTSISQKTISRRNMISLLSSLTCFCQWRILLPHCKCILQIFAHLSWASKDS